MARRIGAKNLYYAPVTFDPQGKATYGSPIRIPKLISISTTDQIAEYTFYSDDTTEESSSKLTGCEVEIELGYIDAVTKAALTGSKHSVTSGRLARNVNDQSPTVAILWEMPKSDGAKSDYRVLYRCKLSIQESESTTVEDGVESNNIKLVGKAIPDEKGFVDLELDGDEEATAALVKTFFTKVTDPEDGAAA